MSREQKPDHALRVPNLFIFMIEGARRAGGAAHRHPVCGRALYRPGVAAPAFKWTNFIGMVIAIMTPILVLAAVLAVSCFGVLARAPRRRKSDTLASSRSSRAVRRRAGPRNRLVCGDVPGPVRACGR